MTTSDVTITETISAPPYHFGIINIGLQFEPQPDGTFLLARVQEDGFFAESELRAGQEVVSINDTPLLGKAAYDLYGIITSNREALTVTTKPSRRLYAGITQQGTTAFAAIGRMQWLCDYRVSFDELQKKEMIDTWNLRVVIM